MTVEDEVEIHSSEFRNDSRPSQQESSLVAESPAKTSRHCPAQEELRKRIYLLQEEVDLLKKRDAANLLSDDEEKLIKTKRFEIEECKKLLRAKEQNAVRNRNHRKEKRAAEKELCLVDPTLKKKLKVRETVGRPVCEFNEDILESIHEIAMYAVHQDDQNLG